MRPAQVASTTELEALAADDPGVARARMLRFFWHSAVLLEQEYGIDTELTAGAALAALDAVEAA